MKKICLLILVSVFLFAGTITKTITFNIEDLIFSKVDGYDVVELKGYPALINPGEPRLPRVVLPVLIPAGAKSTHVEIIADDWVDIPGFYKIYPAQPDLPLPMPGRDFKPELYEPDQDVYSSRVLYPEVKIKLNGSGNMNGYRIAQVELYPLRYIPAQGHLKLARSITYRIHYIPHQYPNNIPTARQKEIFSGAIRSIVVNPEDLALYSPRVAKRPGFTALPPGYYEYVIVSESPMDTVFQRLADWKTKKGVPANVVTVSWINTNYTGYDTQENIREFIIDAQDEWGTIYVLLGGSGDQMTSGQDIVPGRMTFHRTYGSPGRDDTIPSDLYYSDLDGDWDANGNHIYGELSDSVDMYSDVYVGRASVYNIEMAQNFVYKVLTYEKNPPTDYLEKLMLPTAILWQSYEERPIQDSIARMVPADWIVAKMYEREGTLSRQGMIDSLDTGYGMGHWEGHGDENGIYMGSTPYLSSSDADNLNNGDKQHIANSIACHCGGWDLVPGGDCFAEHLVNRVGGGLVAVIMNSRYGFGAYVGGYVPGPSERIDTTYYANIFQQGMFHIGNVHALAKDAWVFYADSGNQYNMTRWCIYELNLFGDPEMPLWTDVPQNLTVNYPAAIPIGNQNVNVTVLSSGNPIEGALVCLQKDTETYASGLTNSAGMVTLNVNPLTPGYMDITATAKNHYPFEDSLVVQSSSYAYVTYLKCLISDPGPGGNNDGKLNPGESVEIPLWVKNWGQVQGTNITGTLGSADAHATLSDTIKNFGDIASDDSAHTGADGYDLDVSESCPDGHALLFTLTCKDDADSCWTSQFSLLVYAPVLAFEDVIVTGGNGDGVLDPGETADLVVTLENEGGATAENITSTLLTSSPYVTVEDSSGDFGSINPGESGDNSGDPYSVTASSSTPYGSEIDFSIVVQAGAYHDTIDFSLMIGQLVPTDTGYYYVYYSGGPHTQSPVFDWIAIDSTQSSNPGTSLDLGDDEVAYIDLPFDFQYYGVNYSLITVSDNGWICMGSEFFYDQTNTGIPNPDGPPAMIAGLWDDLDPGNSGQPSDIYYYYDTANNRFVVEYFRVEHYPSGAHETFEIILYDPEHYPTPTGDGEIIIQYLVEMQQADNTLGIENSSETVGIQYYYDGNYHNLAAVVTDSFALKYTTYPPSWQGIEEDARFTLLPLTTLVSALFPNPGIRVMNIKYQIATRSDVSLCVYDAAGRLVRTLAKGVCDPGYYVMSWDTKDNVGRTIPAGVYFVCFESDTYKEVKKAVIVK